MTAMNAESTVIIVIKFIVNCRKDVEEEKRMAEKRLRNG